MNPIWKDKTEATAKLTELGLGFSLFPAKISPRHDNEFRHIGPSVYVHIYISAMGFNSLGNFT